MPGSQWFSDDYSNARRRFRCCVAAAGGRLDSLPILAKAPDGGDLTTDVGWFGAESPRRIMLHTCGIHGVEAFAGSAIQLQLIDGLSTLPQDTAVLFVHVLNPYGMAWLRRVNENNVDLNRNFLGPGEAYQGHPDGYDGLYDFLNPLRLPCVDLFALRAAWRIARHGRRALVAAVVTGQYDYPEGLFFGGKALQEGVRLFMDFLGRRLETAERMFAIDLHTGLGPSGEDTLMVPEHQYDRLRQLLGARVESVNSCGKGVAYASHGGFHNGLARFLKGIHVDSVVQEFGTYSPVRVLRALRRENYNHHHGARDLDGPCKTYLKAAFCPVDPAWRERVLRRGEALFHRALAILVAP